MTLDNAVGLKTALSGLFKLNNYFRPWLAEKYADYCVASHVMGVRTLKVVAPAFLKYI